MTSTKSMTGHLLGGAGALEAIATILAIQHRVSPPTINLDNQDPAGRARHRRPSARDLPSGDIAALNNSFGFGGANVAVAFGSCVMTHDRHGHQASVRTEDPRHPLHRLTALFDEGTLELITPDDDSGMLAAVGRVDGRRVVAFCSDATVMGGAMGDVGCRVVVDAYHRAMTDGVPIIGLWHSGGARLAEGVLSLHAVGRIFQVMTQASGKIPQVSVVLGPAAGGAAYGPALTDVVILGPEGRIFVTGPDVVRSVTGEDVDMLRLGGPEPHGRRSGVVHILTESEQEALERARVVAVLLGDQGDLDLAVGRGPRPLGAAAGVEEARLRRAPAGRGRARRRLDAGAARARGPPTSSPRSAASAAARVGVVANNPLRLGGCLDSLSAEKASRFVRLCDALGDPAGRAGRRPRLPARASARSGTASYAAGPSCCTRSVSASSRGSR